MKAVVALGLLVLLVVGFTFVSLNWRSTRTEVMPISDTQVTEIGWRTVIDQGVEPYSGVCFSKVSITDNPKDTNSFVNCWMKSLSYVEGYTRENRENGTLQVYVVKSTPRDGVISLFFAVRNAVHLHQDK